MRCSQSIIAFIHSSDCVGKMVNDWSRWGQISVFPRTSAATCRYQHEYLGAGCSAGSDSDVMHVRQAALFDTDRRFCTDRLPMSTLVCDGPGSTTRDYLSSRQAFNAVLELLEVSGRLSQRNVRCLDAGERGDPAFVHAGRLKLLTPGRECQMPELCTGWCKVSSQCNSVI
jgi:hypothetical protein